MGVEGAADIGAGRWDRSGHSPLRLASGPRVDALLEQLRQLTGRGSTEIVRDALETAQPFDPDSLYDEQGLPS